MADRCSSQSPSLDALSKFNRVSTISIWHPEARQFSITVMEIVQVPVIRRDDWLLRKMDFSSEILSGIHYCSEILDCGRNLGRISSSEWISLSMFGNPRKFLDVTVVSPPIKNIMDNRVQIVRNAPILKTMSLNLSFCFQTISVALT